MPIFSKGLVLAQHKEPAFSRPLIRFCNPRPTYITGCEPLADLEGADTETLIEIARLANIIDERDGKHLFRKLNRCKSKAVAVIADAIDDEPYISSRINPLLRLREEAVGGLSLCRKIAGTDAGYIVTYKNITDLQARIPNSVEGVKIRKLRGGYPARFHIEKLGFGSGRKLVVGVGALIHFYRAVTQNLAQSTTFVTVAGNCVAVPTNMEVSLGMTVEQVLDRCGMTGEPTRMVAGGPMTGVAVLDPGQTKIGPTTRGILAIRDNKREFNYSCIGCGRCQRACPRGLNPMYIHRFVTSSYYANLRPFDAHLCMGCGTCSYICPSRLDVAGAVLTAREYAARNLAVPPQQEEDADD